MIKFPKSAPKAWNIVALDKRTTLHPSKPVMYCKTCCWGDNSCEPYTNPGPGRYTWPEKRPGNGTQG